MQILRIDAIDFQIQHTPNCFADHLMYLADSPNDTSHNTPLCGLDPSIASTTVYSSIDIRFHTDGSGNAAGFRLSLTHIGMVTE